MHLKKSNSKILFLSFFTISYLFANEPLNETILSKERQDSFILSQKQIKENSSKLKKDWINPIIYQYKKTLGKKNKTSQSIISINQPIFQSGGIYEAIKYANSTYSYSSLNLEQEKKELIKQALNLLFNIKKIDLNIQKTKLSLENASIDIKRKKEQVLNGFLDTSFLDNALLKANQIKHSLLDLKYKKKDLINKFDNISSKDYKNFELPKFKLFSKEEFLKNNIEVKKAKASIVQKDNFAFMTKARYLPKINFFYNYSKYHDTDDDIRLSKKENQNFGLSLNIPFDTRTFNDIESKKIEHLKSKLKLKIIEKEQENFFKSGIQKLEILDEKIKITNEDIKTYDSILKIIKEEKEAQLKTQSDVITLENSAKIKNIDKDIYEIEKQEKLLEMYVKL